MLCSFVKNWLCESCQPVFVCPLTPALSQDPHLTHGRIANSILLPEVNDEERRAEQRKYGVFFDDDYDYLQHLKEPSGPAELIPSTAFSTHYSDEREETSLCSVSFLGSLNATLCSSE